MRAQNCSKHTLHVCGDVFGSSAFGVQFLTRRHRILQRGCWRSWSPFSVNRRLRLLLGTVCGGLELGGYAGRGHRDDIVSLIHSLVGNLLARYQTLRFKTKAYNDS